MSHFTKPDEIIIEKLEKLFNLSPISPYAVARFMAVGFILFFTLCLVCNFVSYLGIKSVIFNIVYILGFIYLYRDTYKLERQNKSNRINKNKAWVICIIRYELIYCLMVDLLHLTFINHSSKSISDVIFDFLFILFLYILALNWIQPNYKIKVPKFSSIFGFSNG